MESDSPLGMVPMIRNILGGFLFSGDDIYKRAGVLSGGERTRLAVARMLLRPANTLLLDEPTNHLDLDSKDVLLDALEDFGGTLIFVSHDRYFVDRLATKVIAVGHGTVEIYPGTYEQFLWSRGHRTFDPPASTPPPRVKSGGKEPTQPTKPQGTARPTPAAPAPPPPQTYEDKKKADALTRQRRKRDDDRQKRLADLEGRITEREQAIKALEAQMSAPGFYEQRESADTVVAKHHQLMWEVGDLMNQWETLQEPKSSD
jgi:ATP-binding cassette subfamily F protein 3